MNNIENVKKHIEKILKEYNDAMYFENEDGEGIVLDSTGYADVVGGVKEEFNIEVYSIYPNLMADTNLGHIDLKKAITDCDDWYTLEDVVSDGFDMVVAENIGEGFQD